MRHCNLCNCQNVSEQQVQKFLYPVESHATSCKMLSCWIIFIVLMIAHVWWYGVLLMCQLVTSYVVKEHWCLYCGQLTTCSCSPVLQDDLTPSHVAEWNLVSMSIIEILSSVSVSWPQYMHLSVSSRLNIYVHLFYTGMQYAIRGSGQVTLKWKALKCQTFDVAVHVIVLVCWLEIDHCLVTLSPDLPCTFCFVPAHAKFAQLS